MTQFDRYGLRQEPWCPEPRDPEPVAYCEICGGEIYHEYACHETKHHFCVCPYCFRDLPEEEVEDT